MGILSWNNPSLAKEKSDIKVKYSVKQLNFDMPLLVRASIPKILYFEAGPMVSFNAYSKTVAEVTDIYGTVTYEENGGLKAAELDAVLGIGTTRNIGRNVFDFDLRIVIGLTRIGNGEDSPKTLQGQLSATYWFL